MSNIKKHSSTYLDGGVFGLLPPASRLRLSAAAPDGGGGSGRCGGGPGGVPELGEGSGSRLGIGGRAGGPGSGISSRRLLLRSFSFYHLSR